MIVHMNQVITRLIFSIAYAVIFITIIISSIMQSQFWNPENSLDHIFRFLILSIALLNFLFSFGLVFFPSKFISDKYIPIYATGIFFILSFISELF